MSIEAMKHTPGPWKLGPTYESSSGGEFICVDAKDHGELATVVWRMEDDVSHSENLQNQTKASKGNKSGLLGVVTRGNRITAQIKVNGKIIQLGRFPTAEQAHAAYLSAKAIYHPTAPIGGQM